MNMMLQPPGTRADGDYNDCASDDDVDSNIAVIMNVGADDDDDDNKSDDENEDGCDNG